MKYLNLLILLLLPLFTALSQDKKPELLDINAQAPDFNLPGVDDKYYTLENFKDHEFLVVLFTCNHCPTAQAYEEKIIELVKDYKEKGVGFVAISPNDPKAISLAELGYSDLNDDLDDMKIRAKEKNFNFPYLYDGETQEASIAYGPAATPTFLYLIRKENSNTSAGNTSFQAFSICFFHHIRYCRPGWNLFAGR